MSDNNILLNVDHLVKYFPIMAGVFCWRGGDV